MKLGWLVTAGLKLNEQDEDCDTALYTAAENDHVECLKELIAVGTNVNMKNKFGGTPLYTAANLGHTSCVKLLLKSGSELNSTQGVCLAVMVAKFFTLD